MDRKEYLELCRRCAVHPRGVFGTRKFVFDDLQVVYDGVSYYPQSYQLSFDAAGNVLHTAILHDLEANSVVCCRLDSVEKKQMKG